MKFKVTIIIIFLLSFIQSSSSENNLASVDNIFHIGKMDSHNKDFVLFFKTREKAVLARGEEFNYITDYPQDLYIYDKKTKETKPLITYDWFPKHAKFYLSNYDFPVFPEDFAYYLMKDNKTLIMHGKADTIVPFYMGKKMYELANEPKYSYFSEYDDHMMEYNEKLLNMLKKFIDSLN